MIMYGNMMNVIKTFKIGSSVFFSKFDDYMTKDNDIIRIMDVWKFNETNVLNLKRNGDDIFMFRNMTKDEFINDTLSCNTPMRVGKFLVPEFVEWLNFTIDDLKLLKPQFDRLDEKHKYEQVIYDAYIENNAFTLTEKQLQEAYNEYRKYRK